MKNIFALPASFAIPLLIIAVGIVWGFYSIVFKNLNSKDVVFSFSALAAAFAMFYLNISLSMKEEVKEYIVQTHAVVTDGLVIGVQSENGGSHFIAMQREDMSKAVRVELQEFDGAQKAGKGFDQESLKKLKDATVYFYINSILGSMLTDFPDWEATEVKFKGGLSQTFNIGRGSAGGNAFIEIAKLDRAAGNIGRDYTLSKSATLADGLILPPETRIRRREGGIVIDNPFMVLEITVFVPGSFSSGRLGEGIMLNYYPNIQIKRVMKRQRSGHPDSELYAKWADKLYKHISGEFE